MIKCPYCKAGFDENDLEIVYIEKSNIRQYIGEPDYKRGMVNGFLVSSCPKCQTFLDCQKGPV